MQTKVEWVIETDHEDWGGVSLKIDGEVDRLCCYQS
jgi:hypothetical protein